MSEHTEVSTVEVDRDLCLTAAICLAYQVYELDDEGKAVLLTKNGSNSDEPSNELQSGGRVRVDDLANPEGWDAEEMRARVLESAKACPFNAIIVRNDAGEVIWPL